jgi:hypothetical protein
MPNIGAVKSCPAPTQHKGKSEQDSAAPNWFSNCYAATWSNFGESPPQNADENVQSRNMPHELDMVFGQKPSGSAAAAAVAAVAVAVAVR